MAPKKAKVRESASQPVPEQTRRNSKKRRHSDASNVSDRPSSSQSISTPSVPKRRKRTRATPEPEVIVEEEEALMITVGNAEETPACDRDPVEAEEGAEVTYPAIDKHVHFGQASAGAELETISEDELGKATATHITPHPRKMTIKRRVTTSPSVISNGGSKRVKVVTSRTSLPAALVEDGQDPFYILDEHRFAPLREVLQERVRQRGVLHDGKKERLEDLQLELQTQSQLGNVERAEELRVHIADLKKEYKEIIVEGGVVEELDDQMLVLDTNETATYPQLPTHSPSIRTKAESKLFARSSLRTETSTLVQSQSVHEAWTAERRQLEDAIVALSREANDAKTELQILKIELSALGFGSENVSVMNVLLSIRESFARIRDGIEQVLPGSVPEDISNQNLIEILIENVKDFADRLETQDNELQQRSTLVTGLGQQVHDLIDHLAEAKIRTKKLEQGWSDLDKSNDDKSRKLDNLEDELFKAEEERDVLGENLDIKKEEAGTLMEENGKLIKGLKRLTESLENYRLEETRLTILIEKMEKGHEATVVKMNREREETVRELEDQVDAHVKLQHTAEVLAEERQNMIIGLEFRIETIEDEKSALELELQQVKLSRDAEQQNREDAEAGLEEKSIEVQDLEGRVDRLEDELAQLNDQLAELRQTNEAERTQRENAEADLDARNAEVDELNERLRDQGIQANELRQKLFEVQQINEKKLEELNVAASERDEQYQDDIAKEVERREAADELSQERADLIATLGLRLENLENDMREAIALRDERIEVLEEDVAEKAIQIEKLRIDLRTAEEAYSTHLLASDRQREDLEASILSLQQTITAHETTILTIRQEAVQTASLHDSEMEGRNDRIAELNYRVTALSNEVSELESLKLSLEQRLETAASDMLQLQTEKDSQIEELEAALQDKQRKILVVEQKVRETDQRWEEVLLARDLEIKSLTSSNETNTTTITAVTEDLKALKRKFREYVRRSTTRIGMLREALAKARETVEYEGEAAVADGEVMLEEIEAMADFAEETIAVTSASQQTIANSSQASSQQIKKVKGRKRRVIDSGIGMDMDGEVE